MWGLSEQLCDEIPGAKGEAVVVTLTDYMKDIEADQLLIKTVAAAYRTVYFWPQGAADLAYISALADGSSNMVLLPPSLQAFDALLASQGSLDYVGTRLHAGIRALQHRRRTTIIAIDNRATEMGKDFGLPVIPRTETAALADVIGTSRETNIQLPWEAIRQWKSQFVPPDAKSLFE
jgi:polysaccharide pyruvyl transferase WcaK-like protein